MEIIEIPAADERLDNYHENKLIHYKQKFNWDCGLSCVIMVLPPPERNYLLKNWSEILKSEGISKSTWTIDLCYLLKRFNVWFHYYTTTIGINPDHKSQTFYNKILYKDEDRVNERFKNAKEQNIVVHEKSLPLSEIIKHLWKNGPIILLTNARFLFCDKCKHKKLTSDLMSCLPWSGGYQGHYIVLCGYHLKKKKIYYRDPTHLNRICCMSFGAMDKARFSYGTDEDCILIFSSSSSSISNLTKVEPKVKNNVDAL